ncbi:MAG: FtsX-like permease family protein [Archangiaceae bacterium]|nr:FtsX-like permease family protein [Archangiaceae bacterium]
MISKLVVLLRIAFANLFGSFLNFFVGAVLFFGAALLVVGGALFGTLDRSLSKSVVGSITGHLQIYSARSKEKLEVYGKFDGSDPNLAPMENFGELKEKLLKVSNVKSVVPEGTSGAMVGSGNTIDLTLEKLRSLYRAQKDGKGLPAADFKTQADSLKDHVKNMVTLLAKDMEKVTELGTKDSIEPEEKAALATTSAPDFWASFDADPFGHLELLENRIAPQVADADLLFIRYLGTDLDAYQETFDRLQVVEGEKVPKGRRGILLPRFFYEESMKLKNARRLDKIKDARAAGRKLSDESDKELQRFQRENQAQTREIVLQLDGLKTKTAVEKLRTLLGRTDGDLAALLGEFFKTTEQNFDERYKFFYAELAPMLSLYRVKVGDTMTLKSFGRSGSLEATSVKLYGIFEFNGLEKSPLAGAAALIDMVSFRELYGFLTSDKAAELKAMKEQTKARQIDRQNAEADLFGGAGDDSAAVVEAKEEKIAEITSAHGLRESAAEKQARVYTQAEIDDGVVMHAAITLKDGTPQAIAATQAELEKLFAATKPRPDAAVQGAVQKLVDEKKLPFALAQATRTVLEGEKQRTADPATGATDAQLIALKEALQGERARLDGKVYEALDKLLDSARPQVWVVTWNSAAGGLGQFIDVFRLILGAMVFGFALVALIVVTIGVTIATLQRTATIGTLRAIGAQREFVVSMVIVETLVLALVFGGLGALCGAGVVMWLHTSGIPAFRDELYFFFSGPSLKPDLDLAGLVFSIVTTLGVSVLAVLVPIFLAIRVAPVTAMQTSE